ncbi:hypothetical protein [Coleofasciculus sp. E2-BRE-01]|uniref:hypothetical protein n=1 Tax=Coleofasciculus sp. E2-BRE-01 TaxID=3069524 RepID=UPI0032F2B82B
MFSVSPGNAASFQERYQQLVEAWLKTFLDMNLPELERDLEDESANVQIVQTDENGKTVLLYGKDEKGNFVNDLTPEHIQQFEGIRSWSRGEGVEKQEGLTFQINGQPILHVDSRGRATTFTPEKVQETEAGVAPKAGVSGMADGLVSPERSQERESGVSQTLEDLTGEHPNRQERNAQLEVLAELMVPLVLEQLKRDRVSQEDNQPQSTKDAQPELFEDFFAVNPNKGVERTRKESGEIHPSVPHRSGESVGRINRQPTKKGLDAVMESVERLPEAAVKSLMQGLTSQMQSPPLSSDSSISQVQELVRERLGKRNRDKTRWWQTLSVTVQSSMAKVHGYWQQYRAASTLKRFAHQIQLRSGQVYEGASYRLSKQGLRYRLADQQNNPLMEFDATVLGVRVDQGLPPLAEADLAQVQQLEASVAASRQPEGGFRSMASHEADYLARVNRITQALSDYAATQGGNVRIDGKFSYKWRATADGRVRIDAKDGRGALLAKAGGELRSRMDEKDLVHFEQVLKALVVQTKPESVVSVGEPSRKMQLEMD